MTKASIRAMDAVSEFWSTQTGASLDKWIVAGASKRGWTTSVANEGRSSSAGRAEAAFAKSMQISAPAVFLPLTRPRLRLLCLPVLHPPPLASWLVGACDSKRVIGIIPMVLDEVSCNQVQQRGVSSTAQTESTDLQLIFHS